MIFNTLQASLSYEDYDKNCRELKALRSSHYKHLRRSPKHLVAAIKHPKEPSDALEFGKTVHSLFENPWRFMDLHKVEPIFEGLTKEGKMSTRSAAAQDAKKNWWAKLPKDSIVVKASEAEAIYGIWETLKEKKLVTAMLKDGIKEQSLWIKDPETGIAMACRPDFITERGHVIDLKTAIDAGAEHFLQQIFSKRRTSPFYLLQAAHYSHCMKVAGLGDGKSFVFIAMEKTHPYEMLVYPLDEGCLDAGMAWINKLKRDYADCLMADSWPGYKDEAFPVSLPSWFDDPPDIGDPPEEMQ